MLEMSTFWANISNISALVTITGEVRNIISMTNEKIIAEKLEKLCSDISFPELPNDLEIYAQNIDSYINEKKRDLLGNSLFTEDERTCFINEYFARNPDHLGYKSYILPILNKFLDQFEELVFNQFTPEGKVILANEKKIQYQLNQMLDILNNQEVTAQAFSANKLYTDSFKEVLFLHRDIPNCKVTLKNLHVMPKYTNSESTLKEGYNDGLETRLATSIAMKFPFVFIEGDAGCGKSTLIAWLNYHHSNKTAEYRNIFDNRPVVTIRLRDLDKSLISRDHSMVQAMLAYMKLSTIDELERIFPNAIMLLDGFDELCMIDGISDYEELIYDLYRRNFSNFTFVITTRPKYIRLGSINIHHDYIYLTHFDSDKRREWLFKYTAPDACNQTIDADIRAYIEGIDDDSASGICDTPMALYMLVAKKIRAETLKNPWELYHQIFYEELSNTEYNKMFYDPNRNYAHMIVRHRDIIYRISEEIAYEMYRTRNSMFYLTDKELRDITQKLSKDIPELQHVQLQKMTERCYALCNYWKANTNCGAVEFYHNNIRDFFLCEKIFREMNTLYEELESSNDKEINKLIERFCQLFKYGKLEGNVIEFIYFRCLRKKDFPEKEYKYRYLPTIFESMLVNGEIFRNHQGSNPIQTIVNILACVVQIYRHVYEPFLMEKEKIQWWLDTGAVSDNTMLNYIFRDIFCLVPITIKNGMLFTMASKSNFSGLKLQGADLRNIGFKNSDLSGVNFSGAILLKSEFQGSCLDGANFSFSEMAYTKLTGANICNADLTHVDLRYANLESAKLCNTILSDVDLREANLRYSNLSGAELKGTILTGADLTGANLRGAKLINVTLPDGSKSTDKDESIEKLKALRFEGLKI